MSLCLVQSRALVGLEAAAVTVEVHLANGLPNFMLVGLADTEVKEARGRSDQTRRAGTAQGKAARGHCAHRLSGKIHRRGPKRTPLTPAEL